MTNTTSEKHLRFAVLATDVAIFSLLDNDLLVRLIKVNRPPHFIDQDGLPGGLIDPKETAEDAVKRLVKTKAAIDSNKIHIEQLYTFSEINRDPRGRVVAVSYLALVPWEKLSTVEQSDTKEARWCSVKNTKKLAYDHDEILATAIKRLQSRITYTTLIGKLLPKEFTLTELEHIYENILHTTLDKRNFRKKILKLGIITPIQNKRTGGAFRPAQLYRMTSHNIQEIAVI